MLPSPAQPRPDARRTQLEAIDSTLDENDTEKRPDCALAEIPLKSCDDTHALFQMLSSVVGVDFKNGVPRTPRNNFRARARPKLHNLSRVA